MTEQIQTNTPEKKETLADNARKFLLEGLGPEFLNEHGATSFTLTVDWLETGEDNEKKLAYKKFDNGEVQLLLIAKVTKNGNRTTEKQTITEEGYEELIASSVLHLEKKRYEFAYTQNGTKSTVKYDEFANSDLRMMEVDAPTEEERRAFKPEEFPSELEEVSGDLRYCGYRVAEMIGTR